MIEKKPLLMRVLRVLFIACLAIFYNDKYLEKGIIYS
jgi:hypothetical protein